MRWPLVRRSRLEAERERRRHIALDFEQQLEELLFRVARAQDDRQQALDGAKKAHDRAEEAVRNCAQVISDLRAVIWQVRRHPDDGRLSVTLDIPSEMLWASFRHDATFRHALVHMVERLIWETPDLRNHLIVDAKRAPEL